MGWTGARPGCCALACAWLAACPPPVVSGDAAGTDAAVGEDACVATLPPIETLVALGSSSVAGVGASDEAHRFVNLIAAGVRAAALVNLGGPGQSGVTVVGAIAEQARAADPDLVVVLALTDYATSD
ncbi:MAG: hypothetical protein JXR83_08225, partial [Deltaproteobacteria bacterium]|nr:hypothetical protein [Deltaproteobacteria bacterium]